jgi:4-hydroxy-3-polyprenylbenzoate decarboxylase
MSERRIAVGGRARKRRITPPGRLPRARGWKHLEIVFSDYGKRLLMDELGPDAKVDRLADLLRERYGDGVRRGSFALYSNKDLGAPIASGSHSCEGMVIVPCSMKTLAGVALGLSRSLIERRLMRSKSSAGWCRAARTPMSLPPLKNLVACAGAGARSCPRCPRFISSRRRYNRGVHGRQDPEQPRFRSAIVSGKRE